MSRPPLASTATTSAATSSQGSTAHPFSPIDDDAHGNVTHASLARDLSPRSHSAASSPAPAPCVKRTRTDASPSSLPSIEQDDADISPPLFEERAQLFISEAAVSRTQLPTRVDDDSTAPHYDPLLAQRVLHYSTTELPLLLASTAHRRRDLAALAIESRNPLSRLNALPTLGPLQMIEQYVRRSTFRAGVVSNDDSVRFLCASPVAGRYKDAPFHVGELSDGELVACTYNGGASFLQVFDSSLQPQRTAALPVSTVARVPVVNDMVVTQRDHVLCVINSEAYIMHADGTLLTRFANIEEDIYAASAAQTVDGAVALLFRSRDCVHVYSASCERQRSFMLADNDEFGDSYRVRVTSDDDIVVAREGGVQCYRRDGTLLRQFAWPDELVVDGMAVDADSNIVVSDRDHHSVRVFRSDGTFVHSIKPEQFVPRGVVVTAAGHIAVCNFDYGGECVELWS